MIRFIRDPQPPHNSSYRNGMVRDLGPVLNAQFIASGDAVDFEEPGRAYPPAQRLLPVGASQESPLPALTAAQVAAGQALVSRHGILHCSTNITTSSNTGAATTNALASFVLPAGIMGANGLLRFTIVCKGLDSLGAKNIRIWSNSTQLFAFASGSLNNNVVVQHQCMWFNGGAEGSQNTYYNQPTVYGSPSATVGNTGINTAIQQTSYLTADSATASGPTVAKHLFMCELIRGD
jgi:hypothetical protein